MSLIPKYKLTNINYYFKQITIFIYKYLKLKSRVRAIAQIFYKIWRANTIFILKF